MKEPKTKKHFRSWTWFTDDRTFALKRVDLSSFNQGTGIPHNILHYFGIDGLECFTNPTVTLIYNNKEYYGRIDISGNETYRMFWNTDFCDLLKSVFPESYDIAQKNIDYSSSKFGIIRFVFTDYRYRHYIEFIHPDTILHDSENEESAENQPTEQHAEGKVSYRVHREYERNPKNRLNAISYHGCKCTVCGFDFRVVYGDKGNDFIEVHHIQPLSYAKTRMVVNPKTDLVPVCSNCHSIIHRDRNNILSIEQLKAMITKGETKPFHMGVIYED